MGNTTLRIEAGSRGMTYYEYSPLSITRTVEITVMHDDTGMRRGRGVTIKHHGDVILEFVDAPKIYLLISTATSGWSF